MIQYARSSYYYNNVYVLQSFNSIFLEPSSDELKRLMMLHGGNYEHYHSKTKVTHVIATNLPDSKVRELKGEKVVRPEWITDR